MMCSRHMELNLLEKQASFMQHRLANDEVLLEKLHSALTKFTAKTAKYRSACDQLAQVMNDYATSEQISKSMKVCVDGLAQCFARFGDHRYNSTTFLEEEVVPLLNQYDVRFKCFKSKMKKIQAAKNKETNKRRQLTKIRQRLPQNTKLLMKVETELMDASTKVVKIQADLEEYSLSFENWKLSDLKLIFEDFIRAELTFHVDAVKTLTKAFVHLYGVDTEKDFQDFKNVLVGSNLALRLNVVHNVVNCSSGRRRNGLPIDCSDGKNGPSKTPGSVQSLPPTSEWNQSGGSPLNDYEQTSSGEDVDDAENVSSDEESTSSRTVP